MMKRVNYKWTDDDEEYIRQNYKTMTIKEIALELGCPYSTLRKYISCKYRLRKKHVWTKEDDKLLAREYNSKNAAYVAKLFDTTTKAIHTRVSQIHVTKSYRRTVNNDK